MNQIDPFRSFLASSTTIWESARATHGVPAPEFGFTELEHAKRLFEGGKCSVCGDHTDEPILSFGLRVRYCSPSRDRNANVGSIGTVTPQHILFPSLNDSCLRSKLRGLRTILFSELTAPCPAYWAPFHSDTGSGCLFRSADIAVVSEAYRIVREREDIDAEIEIAHLTADRMDACIALENWQEAYTKRKVKVSAENLAFARRVAHQLQVKVARLLATASFARVFRAYNRDLTHLNEMTWLDIRRQVVAELNTKSNAPTIVGRAASTTSSKPDARGCPQCPSGSVARQVTDKLVLHIHTLIL
ncbi:hypothetical protein R3P38DRAFT_3467073 [Favolaschia claudopus]|uniref:Uncharacterized protein n=1 Tax=Favolaschia claudopus TaxID=2862362 RepID=A0AAW0CK33_9AGAR